MEKQFDILVIQNHLLDILMPVRGGQGIALELERFLLVRADDYCDFVFHVCSLGIFQLGQFLQLLETKEAHQLFGVLTFKLQGIVMESVVNLNSSVADIARFITPNRFLLWAIKPLVKLNLGHYIRSAEAVRRNKLAIPILLFLNQTDCTASNVGEMVET